MRMVELRNRTSLAIEALSELRIRGKRGSEDLDGDGAIEAPVAGFVHLSHPTGTHQRQDLVRTETGSGLQRQWEGRGNYIGAFCRVNDCRLLLSIERLE